MKIRIYLANLGKYNEGFLIGKWVPLPVSDQELQEAFERIGVSDKPNENGEYYEEYFITDYEAPFNIGEYDSIQKLNDKVELYHELVEQYNDEIVDALLEDNNLQEISSMDIVIYNSSDELVDEYLENMLDDNIYNEIYPYFDRDKWLSDF